MKLLLKIACFPILALAISCNAPYKQLLGNIETSQTKMQAYKSSIDSLATLSKDFVAKHASTVSATSLSMSPTSGAESEVAMMATAVANKVKLYGEEFQKNLDEYNSLLSDYKAGKMDKTTVEARLQSLDEEMQRVPMVVAKIKEAVHIVEQKAQTQTSPTEKGKIQ